MADSDVVFPTAVPVSRPGMTLHTLRTVHQAIDWVGSLPEATRQKPCWRVALNDLYDADEVRDTRFLNKARTSIIQALRVEHWIKS